MIAKICLLWIIVLLTAFAAAAQSPFTVKDYGERAASDARANYFDLIRELFPEMGINQDTENPVINRSADLRRLSGDGYTLYESPFEIVGTNGWWFEANGAKHLALLLEISKFPSNPEASFDQQYALLVFRYVSRNEHYGVGDKTKIRMVREFRLVEAVDPQTDRFVELPDDFPLVGESPKNQTFWILNHHWNAGESFRNYQTIRVAVSHRLSYGIENLPGVYVSDDCSDNREDSFYVEPLKNAPKNFLPYDFSLRTLIWTKNECEFKQETSYPFEESRIYRARWTLTKNKRRVLRLRVVKFSRKRVKVFRQKGCFESAS